MVIEPGYGNLFPVCQPGRIGLLAGLGVGRFHHGDVHAGELPLVFAPHPDGNVLNLLHALEGNHELNGTPVAQAVMICEVVCIAGPLSVEFPDVIPDAVLGALQLLVLHADISKA